MVQMFSQAKRSLKAFAKRLIYRIFNSSKFINESQLSQLILMNQYRRMLAEETLPRFQDTGCHIYSQTDEDGFLIFIFSLIGSTNKKVVEMCAGDGVECNSANLIINHGWNGLLFDGDSTNIEIGKAIYGFLKSTSAKPPKLVHAWITAENVNDLITSHGFSGEIDLLSIDLDGIDYWLWKAIDCINPRVVILEYNTYWDAGEAVTVPYDPNFRAEVINGAYYCGASLSAFAKLGASLGYRLVGSNTAQYNAFFIRSDIAKDILPEVSVESCLEVIKNGDSLNQYTFLPVGERQWVKV
jgi:hypothetical protein